MQQARSDGRDQQPGEGPWKTEKAARDSFLQQLEAYKRSRRRFADLEVVHMPPDGNCLFHCFVAVINEAFPDLKVTVKTLRWVISRRVTEDEFQTSKAVYEALRDDGDPSEVLHELEYMRGVNSFAQYKMRFMDRSTWGNEQCVAHLRDFCGIQPVIIRSQRGGGYSISGGYKDERGSVFEPEDERLFAVFELRGQHYNLMKFKGLTLLSQEMVKELEEQLEADK